MNKNEVNELRRQLAELIIQARLLRSLDPHHPLHQQHLKENYQKQSEVVKRIKSINADDYSDFIYEPVSLYHL